MLLAGRDGRGDDLALWRLRSPAVFRSIPDSERDPVTAGEAEFGLAHVLQHAADLLDDASRRQVAITAGHQNLAQAQRRCPNQDRLQCLGGPAAGRWPDAVANVAARAEQEVVQLVPQRDGAQVGAVLGDPPVAGMNTALTR